MKIQFSRASEKIRSHFFSRFFEIETLVNDFTPPKKVPSGQGNQSNKSKTLPSAPKLDLDNVKISFGDFLWVSYIIVPNAVLLWIIGICKLLFKRGQKEWMYSEGQHHGPRVHFSHERLVAKMLLESTEIVRYEGKIAVGNSEHATFRWKKLFFPEQ